VRRVTRQEWVWVVAVAGLVVAVSTVPYVAGYLAQTAEVRLALARCWTEWTATVFYGARRAGTGRIRSGPQR